MNKLTFRERFQKRMIYQQNLKIFTISNIFMALAFGFFTPFYFIFINNFGGSLENFGISVGLVIFSGSFVYLFAGKYSDKYGQKPFLIFTGFASAVIVFLYTIINSLLQLYFLQIFSGLVAGIFKISETAYLGNNTKTLTRGKNVGKYFALVGFVEAVAIFGGGFLIGLYGFKFVFYIISGIFLIATGIMFKLKK